MYLRHKTSDACTTGCLCIYNDSNKIQKIPRCVQKLYQQYKAWTPSSAPISGVNLYIIKEGDKLQELSRVPTCHTNMNANLNVLLIPF